MELEIFGIQLNIWGLHCAIGALCAFAAMGVICASKGMKAGSAPVLGLTSLVLGIVCSRMFYCLVGTLTKTRMPLSSWLQGEEGGWSLAGMIGGGMLAAWISAKIIGEKPKRMLDAVSVAMPLMIAAERMGEESLQPFFNSTTDVFNLSRQIASEGFLTIVNNGKTYLATYRIDAALAMVLFLVLVFSLLNKRSRDGDLWIRFMLLCGAGGVLAESLRYDDFLVYSFVRIQQVLFAILLLAGVIAAGRKGKTGTKRLYTTAIITMVLTVAECIGLEFILDRTGGVRHEVLYGVMTAALAIPVIHGWILQRLKNRMNEDPRLDRKAKSGVLTAALILSAAELTALIAEICSIHAMDKFMVLAVASAAAVMILHSVVLYMESRKTDKE